VVDFHWVVPGDWSVHPKPEKVILEAEQRDSRSFTLQIPQGYEPGYPKQAIALDVVLNGKPLGQVTEAVVEFQRYGPAGAQEG